MTFSPIPEKLLLTLGALLALPGLTGPLSAPGASSPPAAGQTDSFETRAERALDEMEARANELGVTGVAVVAWAPGPTISGWTSKMRVVGKMTHPAQGENRGSNLLAIAYAKAAEMADTLQDSGSGARPTMTGETGWQGGLITRIDNGYLIAAFSGGPSEDDLKVSRAGLDSLRPTP